MGVLNDRVGDMLNGTGAAEGLVSPPSSVNIEGKQPKKPRAGQPRSPNLYGSKMASPAYFGGETQEQKDHAFYTSYPKRPAMKHFKDLNETFNSQDS